MSTYLPFLNSTFPEYAPAFNTAFYDDNVQKGIKRFIKAQKSTEISSIQNSFYDKRNELDLSGINLINALYEASSLSIMSGSMMMDLSANPLLKKVNIYLLKKSIKSDPTGELGSVALTTALVNSPNNIELTANTLRKFIVKEEYERVQNWGKNLALIIANKDSVENAILFLSTLNDPGTFHATYKEAKSFSNYGINYVNLTKEIDVSFPEYVHEPKKPVLPVPVPKVDEEVEEKSSSLMQLLSKIALVCYPILLLVALPVAVMLESAILGGIVLVSAIALPIIFIATSW